MKTKLFSAALLVSAVLITEAQAGPGNHGGGGGNFASAGRGATRSSVGPGVYSMPSRSFGGGRMIYSGQRFSSVGGQMPRLMEFRPRYVNTHPNTSIQSRQFANGNVNRSVAGAGLGNRGNHAMQNPERVGNRVAQTRNGNGNLRPDWQKHVFAQHSANWQRDWDRSRDHWWHGHRCHFFNGAWFIFDIGFDPWWYYPYDYYAYYPYYYEPDYYDSGYYGDGYGYRNNYVDQSSNPPVAAVQEQLAREGYYRGQIDGVFGPETRAAIAEFQSNRGLRVTGSLTQQTLAALGLRQVASY